MRIDFFYYSLEIKFTEYINNNFLKNKTKINKLHEDKKNFFSLERRREWLMDSVTLPRKGRRREWPPSTKTNNETTVG
jgi:hypothetical protein